MHNEHSFSESSVGELCYEFVFTQQVISCLGGGLINDPFSILGPCTEKGVGAMWVLKHYLTSH